MFDPISQQSTHTNGSYIDLGRNLSSRIKKLDINYKKYMSVNDSDIQFSTHNIDDETDSYSPPFWKSGSLKGHGNLSPNSRSRAIAQSQKELMEMARNVPESCYELSLRDIVETRRIVVEGPKLDDEERCLIDGKTKKSVKIVKRQEGNKVEKKMDRVKSANLEIPGLFLKMNIPIPFRSKRKKNLTKKKSNTNSNSNRVSPKVESLGKSSSDSSSSGSESAQSGITTINSGSSKSNSNSSSNSNNNKRKSKGWSFVCWAFVFPRKNNRKSKP